MGNNKITKQNLMDQTLCYFVILMDQKYQNNKFCYFVILLFCYFVILMDQNNKFCYFDGSKFVILMDQILMGGQQIRHHVGNGLGNGMGLQCSAPAVQCSAPAV